MNEIKQVFISYKSEEYDDANWVKSVLEKNGISCWMAPMSIRGGSNYASEIPQAIKNCSVFVLILSKNAQKSKWVPRELDQAINENKIVMPFDIDDCALQDDFNFYLTNVQRYNAYQNKSKAIEKMLSEIKAILGVHDNLTSDADEKSGETEFANCVHAEITPALPAEQNAVQAPQKSKSKTKCAKKNKSQKITSEKSSGKKGRAAKGIAIAIAVIAAALVLTIAAASGALSKKVEIGGTKFKANTSSVIIYNKVNITQNDINKMKALEKLSSVSLNGCSLPDGGFAELAAMNLSSLSLSECNIDDAQLAKAESVNPNLVSIDLSKNQITDISKLTAAKEKLKNLNVSGNPIKDYSVLAEFNFRSFSADGAGVSDIAFLAASSDLEEVSLKGNSVESLSSLSACEKLQSVEVSDNKLSDLSGLEHSIKLAYLKAANNEISSLNGIENCTVLVSVDLSTNRLGDVSVLAKSASSLTRAYLSNNEISDISALFDCTLLENVYLDDNSISSISALANKPSLKELSAQSNAIGDITALKDSKSLEYVNLCGNDISDMSALSEMLSTASVYMDLSSNNISAVSLACVSYSFLNLHGNPLNDVGNLPSADVFTLIIDYLENIDFSAFEDNRFNKAYISECPLDKQLSVKDSIGEYRVEFVSEQEANELPAQLAN